MLYIIFYSFKGTVVLFESNVFSQTASQNVDIYQKNVPLWKRKIFILETLIQPETPSLKCFEDRPQYCLSETLCNCVNEEATVWRGKILGKHY